MKTPNTHFSRFIYLFIIITWLFNACNQKHYTYYRRIPVEQLPITEDIALKQIPQKTNPESTPITAEKESESREQSVQAPPPSEEINKQPQVAHKKKGLKNARPTGQLFGRALNNAKVFAMLPLNKARRMTATKGITTEQHVNVRGTLLTVAIVIFLLWLFGFLVLNWGSLVHILLVIVLVLLILSLVGVS